ncbi:MAG: lasso peptide biosynthesis B2 protein [Acidobacteriota bacterium]|nr:lasso peptide biosynthesis B2 protein [Acidobacteriota bacterium]
MSLLRRLARLDRQKRWLLAEAAVIVPIVRIALTVLPFRIVHRGIAAVTRRGSSRTPSRAPALIAWAVTAVAARVPAASCLTQALAATLLLARHGHVSTLRLGVAKNDDGTLRAHAWLDCGGRTILGEPAHGAFTPFPPVALP